MPMNYLARNLTQRSAFLLGVFAFLYATLLGSSMLFAANNIPPAIVRIVVPEGKYTSYGSGTLVAANEKTGLILTNWHVVRDRKGQVEVHFPNGFRSAARVLREDRDWDLAALLVWRPDVKPVRIANRAPQKGEALSIAGYGSGNYRAASGKCVQYLSPGGNHPFDIVELSAGARQGDSGGPILNQRGEMAGVLFGSASGFTSGSHAVRVRNFLSKIDPQLADGRLAPQPMQSQAEYAQNVPPGPRIGAQYQAQPQQPKQTPKPIIKRLPQKPVTKPATKPGSKTHPHPQGREAWIGVPGSFPHGAPTQASAQTERGTKPAPTWQRTPVGMQGAQGQTAAQSSNLSESQGSGEADTPRDTDDANQANHSTGPKASHDQTTLWDQAQTILSLIGGLAILIQVAKFLNPEETQTQTGTKKRRK